MTDTKSALAQIVLPETMDDIEEFLKPEFPPKHQRRKVKEQDKDEEDEDEDEVQGRRIVVDGFGRWREIRPKKYIQRNKVKLVDEASLPKMKQMLGMESPVSSRCSSNMSQRSRYDKYQSHEQFDRSSPRHERMQSKRPSNSQHTSAYNDLGMITRSNVFPGIGNYQWNSTTARTFTRKPVTPVEDRKVFYGLQTDDFGSWAAANVLHERMKKAWGEYQESMPKVQGAREPSK